MKSINKFTQKDVDNRTSDLVCRDCGFQFLVTEKQKERQIGMILGKCGLCGASKYVSHISDWNYLRLN